jgi:hypothetical protein
MCACDLLVGIVLLELIATRMPYLLACAGRCGQVVCLLAFFTSRTVLILGLYSVCFGNGSASALFRLCML